MLWITRAKLFLLKIYHTIEAIRYFKVRTQESVTWILCSVQVFIFSGILSIFRIEKYIELRIALLIVIDRSLPWISLSAVFKIIVTAFLKYRRLSSHCQLFHHKILLHLGKKYWTHHKAKAKNDVSNSFLWNFVKKMILRVWKDAWKFQKPAHFLPKTIFYFTLTVSPMTLNSTFV